ncbi:MAG: L,D-transpeptidase family protein [Actinobacteria bacterium]|nr:L,D-transpeptidase family protein [Actinomycetota bacterium]
MKKGVLLITGMMVLMLATAVPAGAEEPGVTVGKGGSLPPPGGLSVLQRPEDVGRRVALTWQPVPGAFGYLVYRAEGAGGMLVPVGGRAADSMREYPVFLDDAVEPGKRYHYAVASVDGEMREGPLSRRVDASLAPGVRTAGGAKSMTCSLSDQRIYFFEGDQLVNVMRCSTGLSNATPTGNFRILGHYRSHGGLGGAVCDYWMSFTSAHGMHAWPRGLRGYETGLGAPASHGCIRLHPLEAYWPFYWAPDGTPLHITYASLARRVISGCHATIGAAQLSRDWYFAEGYTSEGYDTYLLLSNPGGSGTVASVAYHREDGSVVEQNVSLAPHSRLTIPVDQVPGMDAVSFSAHVHAGEPIVAERAVYFAAGSRDDGTATIGAAQLSRDWYFAEGYTASRFDTYLLLSNPGDTATEAWVHFLLEGGGTVDLPYVLAPHSRLTIPVDALPELGDAAFSMHVHAGEPIVAERAMYFNKGYIGGGHASVGATQSSTTWYFAEGCTRPFFEDYLTVGNPNDEGTFIHVDYQLPDANLPRDYWVGGRSRLTIPVNAQEGLGGKDVACSVFSDLPVVAERSMYYDLDSHRGGHATLGSGLASRDWYFAEGYTDQAFDTYLVLSNPGDAGASVGLEFYREDGAVPAFVAYVGPHRRVTVRVDDLPGLERAAFAMAVHSDQPVMAERVMYFVMTRGY